MKNHRGQINGSRALVGCSEEQYSIGRDLNGLVLKQVASVAAIGQDKGLIIYLATSEAMI